MTCTLELLAPEQPLDLGSPCVADSDPPCPMTGRHECPSDQATIDKCSAC